MKDPNNITGEAGLENPPKQLKDRFKDKADNKRISIRQINKLKIIIWKAQGVTQ